MTELSTAGAAGTPATVTAVPFTVVLLNVRLNGTWAQKFMAAGIRLNMQNQADQQRVIERHAGEAQAVGRDAFRGQRTDAVGNRQADSGTPVFGWKKEGRAITNLRHVRAELEAMGYRIVNVNLRKKDGDTMFSLFVKFAPVGDTFAQLADIEGVLAQVLDTTWKFLHGYRNPKPTGTEVTLNPSHMLVGSDLTKELQALGEEMKGTVTVRDVHVLADGAIRCQWR